MKDEEKARQQLIEELVQLRSRVARHEAQLAMSQQAEAEQQQINRSLPILTTTAGVDGYYKEVNPAFESILGWSRQESLSRPFMEFIHPDDQTAAIERLEQLKAGQPVIEFVDRNICKDGSYRWINWTVIPVSNRGIVFGIGQDVTERKGAESALRESERRLATLMANLPGMAYRCQNDPDWSMEFVSDGALLLTGYQASDLIENKRFAFGDLIHADDREAVWDQVQRAIAGRRRHQLEYRILTATGEERWVWEQGCGIFTGDGELQALEGFITDITPQKHAELELRNAHVQLERRVEERTAELSKANERLQAEVKQRRQAETALRQSHDELQTIYDGIIEGILITDIETKRFLRVNASLCRMLGYSEEELMAAAIKDIHPPEEVSNDERRFEAAAEGRVSINADRPVLRKDGSIFFADITGRRIFYNERPCLLALFRDVTERKQAEEKLHKEQDALRRMLQASDRDRELITYEIHDGIAQRLAAAGMYLEAVSQTDGGISGEARPNFDAGLGTLRKASEEARGLMNRTRTPVLNKFGLKTAIADFIDQFTDRPDAPEITYRCDARFERLEPVLENTMFRVAQEAITNACFHSKSELVRVSLLQDDGEVTIEVQDGGIGFAVTHIKEDNFGLHGIRERVRLLGKNLKIESTPGQGTCIQATFPLVYQKEQADGGNRGEMARRGSSDRAIADDT